MSTTSSPSRADHTVARRSRATRLLAGAVLAAVVTIAGGAVASAGSDGDGDGTAMALLGVALIATGLGLACAVRGTQVRNARG